MANEKQNVAISTALHKRIKLLATKYELSLQEYVEFLIQQGLGSERSQLLAKQYK